MRLNTAQLAAFAAIVREGSFDGAARHLHVTASAISQRLKLLEDNLGQVLVVRGTPCRATGAGQKLMRHAIQLELLESELLTQMGGSVSAVGAPVCIPVAVNADSLDGWFVEAIEEVCLDGRVTLDIRAEDQNHSAHLLREGEVMGAVSASDAAIQGCSAEYLGSMRYFALATPAFRARYFAGGVNALALNQAPMLVYNDKDTMQTDFINMLTSEQVAPPLHFIPSTPSFVRISARGFGWGMIPQHLAQPYLDTGALVEIAPGVHVDVKLYWHRWQVTSMSLNLLTNAVNGAANRHLHNRAD